MNNRHRLHVVALPHTQTHPRHNACAFTENVLKFCKMMTRRGHTVIHYGAEGSDVECSEHVEIISSKLQEHYFGAWDKEKFYPVKYDAKEPYWKICNLTAIQKILERKQPRDFLCLIAGLPQKPIADAMPKDVMVVEYAVGYRGVFAPYRCYGSYAHMHAVLGSEGNDPDGHSYRAVIPHACDKEDFPFQAKKEDYFLYLGRLTARKGVGVAVEAVGRTEYPLKIAGQGAVKYENNTLTTSEGSYQGIHIRYVGHADVAQRAKLMGGARAILCPTQYVEPFGKVAVEAQMCGSPVISTDFGGFTETIEHGKTGYRCRTLEQFVWAVNNVHRFVPAYIRNRAVRKYSLETVGAAYEEYFNMLSHLWGGGWNEMSHAGQRTDLDWLNA